jgi:predicted SprT family Zn-dependent metalloprotease
MYIDIDERLSALVPLLPFNSNECLAPRIVLNTLGLDTIAHYKSGDRLIEINDLYFPFLSEITINYLILHELCHVFRSSHDSQFRQLLESVDARYRYHEILLQKETDMYKPRRSSKT